MTNDLEPSRRGSTAAEGISVYVLRDPRDGVVYFVGRAPGSASSSAEKVDGIGPTEASVRAREGAIVDEGYEVERLIVAADLANEAEAAKVERAVIASYVAAQLMPTSLTAAHRRPGHRSSVDPAPGGDPFDHPSVRQFVAQAAQEIERLSSAVARAEKEPAAGASPGFLDADHRDRLESTILQQESEIAQLNAAVDRVRAVMDLARWAARTAGGDDEGVVIRIADLNRALGSSPIDEGPA